MNKIFVCVYMEKRVCSFYARFKRYECIIGDIGTIHVKSNTHYCGILDVIV